MRERYLQEFESLNESRALPAGELTRLRVQFGFDPLNGADANVEIGTRHLRVCKECQRRSLVRPGERLAALRSPSGCENKIQVRWNKSQSVGVSSIACDRSPPS